MRGIIDKLGPRGAALVAALVALIGVVTVGLTLDTDEHGKPRVSVTVTIGKTVTPGGIVADRDNELDAGERDEAQTGTSLGPPGTVVQGPAVDTLTPDVHEDSRDESPGKPGIENPPAAALKTAPGVGKPQPVGGAQPYSCRPHFVRNYSDRVAGVRVSMFVLHFTVSAPGSLDAIRGLFNTPSFGASSTFGIELAGRCEQWVPFAKKPWTNGAANSASETVEVVTFDRTRAQWLASPIIRDGTLAALVADRLKARGLPPKLVDPVGCSWKAGYTDHARLECGNTHYDMGANFPWDVFGTQVRRAYNGVGVISKSARDKCTRLNRNRRHTADYHKRYGLKPVPSQSAAKRRESDELRVSLKRGRYVCKVGKPGVRGTITRRR